MQNDLISIGIPTFNRSKLLITAISSALNQSYKNIEIIISNNCSTDNTAEILKPYKKLKNIKVFNQRKNIGVVNNWNFCLNKSKGKYFIMLSDDDELKNDCINDLIRGFIIDNVSMSLGKAEIRNSKKIKNDSKKSNHINILEGEEFISQCLNYSLVAYPSALLFNTELAKKNGCYPNIGTSTDFAMVLNLSVNNKIAVISSNVCIYKVHENSISRSINSINEYESYLNWSINNNKLNTRIKFLIKKYISHQIFRFALRNSLRGNLSYSEISKQKLNKISKNKFRNLILSISKTRIVRAIYKSRNLFNSLYFNRKA
jgi:glycosyltransferase involved in cell wall biosynthesis